MVGVADLEKGLGYVKAAGQIPIVSKAIAYAGKPLISDVRKVYGINQEKDSPVINFFKRHVFTLGIGTSVVANIATFILGKVAKVNEDAAKSFGFITGIVGLAGAASFVASIYSSITGKPKVEFIGWEERVMSEGKSIIDGVRKPIDDNYAPPVELKTDTPLRFNPNVQRRLDKINIYEMRPDLGNQAFLVGESRTGKTALCKQVIGMIKHYEASRGEKARTVEAVRIEGKELLALIENPNPQNEQFKQLASVLGAGELAGLLGSSTGKIDLLRGIVLSLKQRFDESREDKRFVLLLDEFDALMALAKDESGRPRAELLDSVFGAFADLLEDNKNDIFFTSNKTLNDMCGTNIQVKDSSGNVQVVADDNAKKFIGRMTSILVEMDLPNTVTKTNIIGVYLKQKAAAYSDRFDPGFLQEIKSSGEEELGKRILDEISTRLSDVRTTNNPNTALDWCKDKAKDIFEKVGNNYPLQLDLQEDVLDRLKEQHIQYIALSNIAGGHIEDVIKRLSEGGTKITLESVVDSLLAFPAMGNDLNRVDSVIKGLEGSLSKSVTEQRETADEKVKQKLANDNVDEIENALLGQEHVLALRGFVDDLKTEEIRVAIDSDKLSALDAARKFVERTSLIARASGLRKTFDEQSGAFVGFNDERGLKDINNEAKALLAALESATGKGNPVTT